MLSKRLRLGRSEDLRLVIRTGRPTRVQGLFIRTRHNNIVFSRYAIAIPREAEKHATARNKMRRQLFETIQKIQKQLRQGFDVYISVRKELFALPQNGRSHRLQEVFQKAGIFINKT